MLAEGIISKYFNTEDIIDQANQSLSVVPMHITDAVSHLSEGGKNDFYSNGDYWWPNPNTIDGLPYVKCDGESNPDNFNEHRKLILEFKVHTGRLVTAYTVTKNEMYAKKAVQLLEEFFLDKETRMNPNLLYAQAIPGICSGRGIGIIDTVHLMDIPLCIEVLKNSIYLTEEKYIGLQGWFKEYIKWMRTHPYGIEEMNTTNNHSVCYFAQLTTFAHFVSDKETIAFCLKAYKEILLPKQMDVNGSFQRELSRTKPYNYSYFVLDNMVTICHILSRHDKDIWKFATPDGQSIEKGLEFFVPFIEDITKWPYAKDIEHFEEWPIATSMLLFAGLALDETRYLELYDHTEKNPRSFEISRNMVIKCPLVWL